MRHETEPFVLERILKKTLKGSFYIRKEEKSKNLLV
jgi:hypothetical protein